MARNLDAKCRQCRRAGEKLFLKGERCDSAKCAFIKRKYPPGVHGPKQRIRLSEYGLQLREKQKIRKSYGMLERQFRSFFVKASKMKGDAGYNFINMLEHRLDNVIFRAGLASSRDLARQAVSHGHVLVNGKKVTVPSYIVKVGEEILSRKKSFLQKSFGELAGKKNKDDEMPSWLSYDKDKKGIKIISDISEEDMPKNFDVRMVIEYYSK